VKVWLVCEFTSVEEPELHSVGSAAENGRECSIELLDGKLRQRSSDFGRVPDARAEGYQDLCSRLEGFSLAIGSPAELLHDCQAGRDLVQQVLEAILAVETSSHKCCGATWQSKLAATVRWTRRRRPSMPA
jgi:hypothetical protein